MITNKKCHFVLLAVTLLFNAALAQKTASPGNNINRQAASGKSISADLFGVFFEDLSYSADGGLYAELVQNRSFEYSASDKKEWHPLTAWEYTTQGFGYGTISVETSHPLNANNPHYVVLDIDDAGQEGVGITNDGYDGMALKAGEKYNFSVYIHVLSARAVPVQVLLRGKKGIVYGSATFTAQTGNWKKYSAVMTSSQNADSARLVIVAKTRGKVAMDEVSLFPENTYKNQSNGLRADLAQTIAGLQPKFMRFPGGCLVHGDGLGNMYRWKNTIGPVEQRVQQRNIWNYHQSVGLGFYEYFRFCEDIGAKPLPVVAAGVSCQNSGGTWRIGGTGQKALAVADMKSYIQDVLDLIEYANGPVTSKWGAKRAAAGHPKPFHLQYVGIGNEDKQTDDFRSRFKMIYDVVKLKHPEIIIIGTVGPAPSGDDYDKGWKLANELAIPVVDEHFYETPEWFLHNNRRYDSYSKSKSQVYIGEYASKGNALLNAIAEATFMTAIERNGDVVRMASYAPLLANTSHTSWNPNLVYFNNKTVAPTINYYVQQLFSANQGDVYYDNVISFAGGKAPKDSTLAASCVKDSKTGDVIFKIVNAGPAAAQANINMAKFNVAATQASLQVLTGNPKDKNTITEPGKITPVTSNMATGALSGYSAPPYSLSVIRIKTKG
jgi:alpha-L-arabinofuranosidase